MSSPAGRLGIVLALSVWACAVEQISVAELENEAGSRVRRCSANTECRTNEYCATASCGQPGLCQSRPVLCDAAAKPVCGCDGVTYWNDCIRSRTGVALAGSSECTSDATSCADPSNCPIAGASCARLLPAGGPCDSTGLGTCWMLPADCNPSATADVWASCADQTVCEGTCAAIASGITHLRVASGTCP